MVVTRRTTLPRTQADLGQLVHQPPTEAGRLQRGVELAVATVDGCDHAGVTVLTPHYVETVAASDDVVRRGEGWQYELSEGAGLDSVRHRVTVVSQDLGTDPRWRRWGPMVADGLGVRSMMSALLDLDGDTVGALTLYADRVEVWDEVRQAAAALLAGQLSAAVLEARTSDTHARALLSRTGVGQAQGIVMERFGWSANQAADYLHRLATDTRVGLGRLAEHIVATREIPRLPGGRT